jgi:phosphinothricin acetyltransferase
MEHTPGAAPAHVRPATVTDMDAVNRIYNEEILHGVATWDMEPWPLERRQAWFTDPHQPPYVVVAEVEGAVIGFGYLSLYRERAGYRFTREDTVYIDPAYHRRGIGRALLGALLEHARTIEAHAVVARIEASNASSVALHGAFGFEIVGREREIGHKFGRWLDLVTMELLLDNPA